MPDSREYKNGRFVISAKDKRDPMFNTAGEFVYYLDKFAKGEYVLDSDNSSYFFDYVKKRIKLLLRNLEAWGMLRGDAMKYIAEAKTNKTAPDANVLMDMIVKYNNYAMGIKPETKKRKRKSKSSTK